MRPQLRDSVVWPTLALLAAVTGIAGAGDVVKSPLPPSHPLTGSWVLVFPDPRCHEEYEFRDDGTRYATSGQQILVSDFSVSEYSGGKGHPYLWVDKIVSSNGKADCNGNDTPVGDVATNYIYMEVGNHRLWLCKGPDPATAYAAFDRKSR